MSQTSPLGLAERKRSEDRPTVLHVVRTSSKFSVAASFRNAWASSGRASGPADRRGCDLRTRPGVPRALRHQGWTPARVEDPACSSLRRPCNWHGEMQESTGARAASPLSRGRGSVNACLRRSAFAGANRFSALELDCPAAGQPVDAVSEWRGGELLYRGVAWLSEVFPPLEVQRNDRPRVELAAQLDRLIGVERVAQRAR